MHRRLTWILLSGALMLGVATCSSADLPGLEAEGFEHYTLALTWHAGFCRTHRQPPRECRDASFHQEAQDGFVLHGLWPSLPEHFADEGVTRERWWSQGCFLERPRGDGGFCRAHAPFGFDASLAEELDNAMPGRTSCLDRYQYAKHAACLALPADDYFATAIGLLEVVNNSAFVDFVMINQGGTVDRNALIGAFEAAFGKGVGRALSLQCRGRGNRMLTEIRIGIDAERLDDFPSAASLVALRRGRCASKVHIAGE